MSSIKCSNCGLSNFSSDIECRRCGTPVFAPSKMRKEKPPRRFSVISFVIYAALIVGGYYLYQGMKASIEDVNANDSYRIASQPVPKATPQLSRNEADRQHAGQVGNAIKNNPSFAAQKQHDEETQRAMRQSSANSQ